MQSTPMHKVGRAQRFQRVWLDDVKITAPNLKSVAAMIADAFQLLLVMLKPCNATYIRKVFQCSPTYTYI